MENLEESAKTTLSKNSFFQHVFKFDDDSKSELLNIGQYSVLSIIPIVFLNKSVQKIFPEVNDEASTLELLAEIIGQILVMFIGIFFIHRLVTFIPTYSKTNYEQFNVTSIVIAFLVIVLSLHTKLGEKSNILIDRLFDMIEGKKPEQEGAQNQQTSSRKIKRVGSLIFDNCDPDEIEPRDIIESAMSLETLPFDEREKVLKSEAEKALRDFRKDKKQRRPVEGTPRGGGKTGGRL